ncbi:MAG TPA: FtsX-like permease family protein, partial [Solirubrobacteraceae bacterium]|nr:FtsX-like permease family protein [Solirubrobacteraceae bacterium]
MSIGLPFTLYAWRLRTRAAQELLAATGIAVGVALVFGVLVANTSIGGSARGLVHQLIGSAQLQLVARSQEGFSQQIARRVESLPGVQATSPLLREDVMIDGSRGSEPIQLIGLTVRQLALNPEAARDLGTSAVSLISNGIGLPSSVAEATGANANTAVTLRANGKFQKVRVDAVLGSQTVGAVASSPVAIALLDTAQMLTGEPGRVTSVLVKAQSGARAKVARELGVLAAGRADVTSADNDLRLLASAAKPNQQSTTLFAAIAGTVGFLLALNAMLLTTPERRRLVAELRTYGYDPAQIVLLLAVQALALGIVGSIAGIALGYVLSHTLFAQVPSYLAIAFPIGTQKIVTARVVLIALGGGLLAALLASTRPLLDLRRGRPIDEVLREQGEAGQGIDRRLTVALAFAGVGLVLFATILALAVPSFTLIGGVLLAVAVICLVPFAHAVTIGMLRPLSERSKGVFSLAIVELESTAVRSTALAAIVALAVYGSLAIGGARSDLTQGLETAIHQDSAPAQIWITTGDNVFNTDSFQAGQVPAEVARAPGVASVRADQGALLNVGDRRVLIRVHSSNIPTTIQSSQVIEGDFGRASELIRRGGWATISQGLALERHLHIGEHFILPTPSGVLSLGVAAITTNLGWPAGAVTFSTADYVRGWQNADPSALEVNLKPGVTVAEGKRAVRAALDGRSALFVQTVREREAQADGDLRQGLSALGQISMLVLITGALAVAASLGAVIWQRRTRLAAMKMWGYDHLQLWRSLLFEGAILLTIGCFDGTLFGIYGHAFADRWLRLTTDFP